MGAAVSDCQMVFLSKIEQFGGLRHLIIGADFQVPHCQLFVLHCQLLPTGGNRTLIRVRVRVRVIFLARKCSKLQEYLQSTAGDHFLYVVNCRKNVVTCRNFKKFKKNCSAWQEIVVNCRKNVVNCRNPFVSCRKNIINCSNFLSPQLYAGKLQ